ncbi:HD domain-containing protein [Patescibacteria group bacterium]|nr:HD domain-containing protein [Patescibacteria group bacterium]
MNPEIAKACTDLGALAFRFAAINRVTHWPDLTTLESDTDHTVMLGLVACSVASKHAPHLDVGLIAQFSLVHDLVEAYAGDTNTFGGLSEAAVADKEEREAAALQRIRTEFGNTLPWVPDMIEQYESLATPEARFIKTLDKCMPKITRLLNGHTLTTKVEFDEFCTGQIAKIRSTYGADQEMACALYELLSQQVSLMLEKQESAT